MSGGAARGAATILAAALLWGTTGTAQSFAPAAMPAIWVGALRLAIACAFFAALGRAAPRGDADAGRVEIGHALLAGAAMAAYNLTFFAGVRSAGIAIGTAVAIGSGPVWAGVLQASIGRVSPPRAWWAGTLLSVAGGALLAWQPGAASAASPAGIALCLAAGLSYAAYALANKRLVARAAPARSQLVVFAVASAIAVPAAFAFAGPPPAGASGWIVVAYLGVVATGVAYLLFSLGLRAVSGATGVTLALAEPVAAFVLAVAVVGERPGWTSALGLAAIVAGLATVVRAEAAPAGVRRRR